MFDPAHLVLIRRALEDDTAYALLAHALPRLEAIIVSAKEQGCTVVRCTLRERDFRIVLRFAGSSKVRSLTASFSFRKKYEQSGKRLSRETALALRVCMENLVVVGGRFHLMK